MQKSDIGKSDEKEESITMNKLKPKTQYRIIIFNRGEELRVTFDLRVEIIERPKDIKVD